MISAALLESILNGLPRRTIGLVGDLFLDRYLDIDPELHELSVETGLEAYQVTRVRNYPGALGTVLNNLAALGTGRLVPVTVLGDDGQAYDLLRELSRLPVDAQHVVRDERRRTPTYTKPMRRGPDGAWGELNRLDLRNRAPLPSDLEEAVVERVAHVFATADATIVLDQVNEQGWGVVTPRVRDRLRGLARERPEKLMFVDSRAQIARFDFGVLKPNRAECLAAAGLPATGDAMELRAAARRMAQRTGRTVFCTLGEQGTLVVPPHEDEAIAPAIPVAGPIDAVGAGDSTTAGIVSALLGGADELAAATFGNLVASITVQQLGVTGAATPEQVRRRWSECAPADPHYDQSRTSDPTRIGTD